MSTGTCVSCGHELPADARFCPSCGQPVATGESLQVPSAVTKAASAMVARDWVLTEIDEWLAGDQQPWLLIQGEPGAGKTTLAAWLCGIGPVPVDADAAQRLARLRSTVGACHFCVQHEGGSTDPRLFVRGLAEQLGNHFPAFEQASAAQVNVVVNLAVNSTSNTGTVIGGRIENLNVQGTSVEDLYTLSIRAPLASLAAANSLTPTIIVIDGLDQAAESAEPNIVTLLQNSTDLPPQIRLLLITRSTTAVTDRFPAAALLDLTSPSWKDAATADITAFVRASLPPATSDDVAERVAESADRNFQYATFVLAEIAAGKRSLDDLGELPQGLFGIYRSYLDDVVPTQQFDPLWTAQLRPVLGKVAVANPLAPRRQLGEWTLGTVADIAGPVRRAQELIEYLPADDGGYRLFHRSLSAFLSSDQYTDRDQPRTNDYYIDPASQHADIALSYFNRLDGEWKGDWTNCDSYGLRSLSVHLAAHVTANAKPSLAARLYGLAMDEGFRSAQMARHGMTAVEATARHAVDAALQLGDAAAMSKLVQSFATHTEPLLRGVAIDSLSRWAAQSPADAYGVMTQLLTSKDLPSRHVALRVATATRSLDTFRWIALQGDDELQDAALLSLSIAWSPDVPNLADELLDDLAGRIKLSAPIQSTRLLVFMGSLSVFVYISNCWYPSIVTRTSDLWHSVLCDRLKVQKVNRPAFEPIISRAAGLAYSKRLLQAALFDGLQDPSVWFKASQEVKAPFVEATRLLDPDEALGDTEIALIESLFRSEQPLCRAIAAMVIAVRATCSFEPTAPIITQLYDQLPADSRLWVIASLSLPMTATPDAWTGLLDGLTGRYVGEDRDHFVNGPTGALTQLDLALLPSGLAHGKAGTTSDLFDRLLSATTLAADPQLTCRAIRALGPVGFYQPQLVLGTMARNRHILDHPDARAAVFDSLPIISLVHFEAVSEYLRSMAFGDQSSSVLGRADSELVRRYVTMVGYYTNAVHQALNYPLMRQNLLIGGLTAMAKAKNSRSFIKSYTAVPLRMLREKDYRLSEWTGSA